MICGLALVLMLDASGSVPDTAWRMQVEAHADALDDPRIGRAMAGQGITAVTLVGYDDTPRVLVPWRIVDVAEDAAGVAREVMAVTRPGSGRTMTGAALAFAMEHVERAPCVPERIVVDVVTDGSGDDERRLEDARDEAIARGIRVNALVVNTYGAPAADWARQALVTPSGFVMEADGWQEVAAALRRKVTQEVSQR
jgi:hypothetical protein